MKISLAGKHLPSRTIMALLGVLLGGLCVGIMRVADLGLDPYQCFATGVNKAIPISFGTLYLILNMIQLVIVFFLDRRYINITTALNLFLVGYVVEFAEKIVAGWFPAPDMATRLILLAVALILTCLAAALYYTAALGVSTYDAIPLHIADCKPKFAGRVIPFRFIRIVTDLICVGVGLCFGLVPGIGTIATALCMGPLITFFRDRVTEPIMANIKARKA